MKSIFNKGKLMLKKQVPNKKMLQENLSGLKKCT